MKNSLLRRAVNEGVCRVKLYNHYDSNCWSHGYASILASQTLNNAISRGASDAIIKIARLHYSQPLYYLPNPILNQSSNLISRSRNSISHPTWQKLSQRYCKSETSPTFLSKTSNRPIQSRSSLPISFVRHCGHSARISAMSSDRDILPDT